MLALGWLAALLGLVPALWLGALALGGRKVGASWWWMAAAFAVSALADLAGRLGYGIVASQVYPVMQAALFAVVLLSLREAEWVVLTCLVAAGVSIALRHGEGLDVLLRVTAWGAIAGVAWLTLRGTLRHALAVGFASGTLAWVVFVAFPSWGTWAAYQTTRAVMIGWFCLAAGRAMSSTRYA